MPANLTPQYRRAEREYRRAQSAAEQLQCLQTMLQLIPRHKGTDKLQAELKARLSETRRAVDRETNAARARSVVRFPRQGAGRIVVIGAANAGKSRLVRELTRAEPEVAEFPFTTREALPAMMDVHSVQVQLIDTPPIVAGQLTPAMLNLVRTADAAALVVSLADDDAIDATQAVIQELRSRKTELSPGRSSSESDETRDYTIVQLPTLVVLTQAQAPDALLRRQLLQEILPADLPWLSVDLAQQSFQEPLREALFSLLNVIRIFPRRPGEPLDRSSALTIPADGTIEDLALQIHEGLAESLRYAKVWGEGRHDGQTVGRDYLLSDGDVVELHC